MFLSLFVLSLTDNDVMYGRNFNATVAPAENYSESSYIVSTDAFKNGIGSIKGKLDNMIALLLLYTLCYVRTTLKA